MSDHLIVGLGGPSDRNSLALETRRRRRIDNFVRRPSAPAHMIAARELILGAHQQMRLRSLDSTYNCMGMVFAARRTWIEPEMFVRISEDDGYRELALGDLPVPGDVVVYFTSVGEVAHVGWVISREPLTQPNGSISVRVLSQFGADGEYFHDSSDLPHALGAQVHRIAYYSDRRC